MESHGLFGSAGLAGKDFCLLYPFRAKLIRAWKLYEIADVPIDEFRQRLDDFPTLKGMRDVGVCASNDGLRHWQHNNSAVTIVFAMRILASPDKRFDLTYINSLPAPGR